MTVARAYKLRAFTAADERGQGLPFAEAMQAAYEHLKEHRA